MPRRLLARVRDVMAGDAGAEERLNQVVSIIAAEMSAEVCSIYVRRAGEVLELFATQGLKQSAVHNTRLRVGEGLVGEIAARAKPSSLTDAQSHPNFAYRPETGEEIYHSLMGVPLLRSGRVNGVVVVQNRSPREYEEEEVEALQTVAMVLAEVVAGGDLLSREEQLPADGNALLPLRLEGVQFNAGIGIGTAVLHQPRYVVENLVAEDLDAEHARLREAVSEMHGALDTLLQASDIATGGDHTEILETYRMIAEDAGWLARIGEAIASGLTAEAAVQKVLNDIQARMSQVTDPYLRERIHDFEDLADRLLQHLVGSGSDSELQKLPDDVVLVARSMGPAQLLDYDRRCLKGLVLEEGSSTSHVAIVARALDIPVVGCVQGVAGMIEEGEPVIVDGDNAQVFIRPGEEMRRIFFRSAKALGQRKAGYASLRELRAVTRDGERISIQINAGLLIDLEHLKDMGAAGVGLYRTEVPFMVRSQFPDVETQQKIYARVIEQAAGKPVAFRTLDVGGDKVLPYWRDAGEENPAMGWRAIRIGLDRPSLLRQQLRALIRAAAGGPLCVMFPMIAEVSEFIAARKLLDMELEREVKRGGPLPGELSVGAMMEVPALLFQLPALLRRVDFISIGSNDLLQFLFASDRGNARTAGRYDPLSPAVLRIFRDVLVQCRQADVPVSVCGEMAGNPLDAMALIGMGYRSISLSPPSMGQVKTMIRSLEIGPLETYMENLYQSDHRNLRENLRAFARDHGVKI